MRRAGHGFASTKSLQSGLRCHLDPAVAGPKRQPWRNPMLRKLFVAAAAGVAIAGAAFAQAQFGTAAEARAMLDKAIAALKADKSKALADFNKPDGGFRDRDLYVFCAAADTKLFTAHPNQQLVGT